MDKLHNLYHLIDAEQRAKATNSICSPFNIASCLSMLADGTSGTSREELIKFFDFNKPGEGKISLKGELAELLSEAVGLKKSKIADSVRAAHATFVAKVIKEEYQKSTKENYAALVKKANFEDATGTAQEVNGFVAKATNNHITALVSPSDISSETIMILVAALYFEGKWTSPFEKEASRPAPWFSAPQKQSQCTTMHQKVNLRVIEYPETGITVMAKPYKGDDLWFVTESYAKLEIHDRNAPQEERRKIDKVGVLPEKSELDRIFKAIASNPEHNVQLSLPKFKVESKMSLKNLLKYNGCSAMFEKGRDFDNIAEVLPDPVGPEVKISDVICATTVSCDELGTVATAAAAVLMCSPSCAVMRSVYYSLNSPFRFSIVSSKHKAVLFSGVVMDPTK